MFRASFDLRGPNDVGFQVGSYDHTQPLIIDPILVYSTYFGGSGNDQALAVAVDDQGAAYITGSTLSLDLATTAGAAAPSSFISEVFKSTNSAASWSGAGVGLPDASFSALVVDPTNPNIVYGGTDGNNGFSAQGLFKSTDGGASWTPIDNGLPTGQVVGSLVIDPSHPSTLYAALGAFLFKTTDGGSTWSNSGTGIASSDSAAGLGALAISPSNPQTLYVMASRNYLYKTTNGGANWTRINGINPGTPSEKDQLPFTQRLIVDPTDPNTIYAGVTKGVFFNTPGDVYKSTNGGATFHRTGITTTSQFSVLDMVMDPEDRKTLYLLVLQFSSNALYRTTNGGTTWTQLSSSTGGTDLAMAATPGGSTLYMAVSGAGIVKSTDRGNTFTNANLGVGQVTQIGVSASSPGTLYAATPGRPKDELNNIATDAFVAKLNPAGTAYDYITYLGGPGVDVGYGIAVDSNHNAYITGKTIAGTFPTTPGAFQAQSPSTSQRLNAFVTKLSPTGSSLVYSTYLAGTSGGFTDVEDHGTAIAVDGQGRAAVTGVASSSNFPTTSNAFDTSFFGAGTYKAFVTLLKPDGSGLLYSTFLGGNNNDENLGRGIAFDAQGNIHVAGETSNEDSRRKGPTGFPTTSGAYQSSAGVPLCSRGVLRRDQSQSVGRGLACLFDGFLRLASRQFDDSRHHDGLCGRGR